MGKITSETQNRTTKTHFSHPHPLELTPYHHHHQQQTLTPASSCSACNLEPSDSIYTCTTCNFFLHKRCFEMPMKIAHPFHNDHIFTLLPKPVYAECLFNCDACGKTGEGFSYHCEPCSIDLHILCAVMPLSIIRACHVHELKLTFESPYGDKNSFCCDICRSPGGSSHWLYRCGSCGFDAHLNCAFDFQTSHAPERSRSAPQPQHQGSVMQFCPAPPSHPMHHHHHHHVANNVANGVPAQGPTIPGFGVGLQSNASVFQAIQQMAYNNNVAFQSKLAGGAGGFNGSLGGYAGSCLDGGAGGQDFVQAQMNGGGGGGGFDTQSSSSGGNGLNIQSLLSGGGGAGGFGTQSLSSGGGNGLNIQSLLNGGGGGGGPGLDIQSLLGAGVNILGGALGGFSL